MAKAREQQETIKDTVSTEFGVVHVMPTGYQGGKLPEGSKAKVPEAPAKHELKTPPAKKPAPKPVPKVKRPAKKPAPPKKNPHKKRVLLIVGGAVVVVLLIVVLIVALSGRGSEPEVVSPVVAVPEPPAVVTPDPIPDPDPTPDPDPEPDPFVPPEPSPGRDTDSDGLSDVEERLYGSNVRLPDTDRDGFLDGNEVFHGYDPSKPAPTTLLDTGYLRTFDEEGVSFTFLYPRLWTVAEKSTSGGDANYEVTAPSGESVLVTRRQLSPQDSLETYLEAVVRDGGDPELLDVEYSLSKAGYRMAVSKDQMRATIVVDDMVFVLIYRLGTKTNIDFVQTFQMLVNSLDVVTEEV